MEVESVGLLAGPKGSQSMVLVWLELFFHLLRLLHSCYYHRQFFLAIFDERLKLVSL